MKKDEYWIVEEEAESLYKSKGSKFIGHIFHVTTVEEVDERINELKKAHHKARHFCYAYRMTPGQNLYRINDDGEPSGSAGNPIYGQIKSAGLYEVLIVVIRYFGGTKLGVSGLIKAYKTAAESAIGEANKIKTYLAKRIELDFDYAIMGDLMNVLKQTKLNVDEHIFDKNPKIILKLHQSKAKSDILRLKATYLGRSVEDVSDETEIEGLQINELDN